jgi:hypothetical protein
MYHQDSRIKTQKKLHQLSFFFWWSSIDVELFLDYPHQYFPGQFIAIKRTHLNQKNS